MSEDENDDEYPEWMKVGYPHVIEVAELKAEMVRLRERLAAAEAVCEALDVAVESLPHIHGAISSTVADVRDEANAMLDAVVPPLDAWRAARAQEEAGSA